MNPDPPLPTSAEVDRRLRLASELRDFCLSLGRAKRVPDPDAPSIPSAADTPDEPDPPGSAHGG